MKITPLDIRQKTFENKFRGYDKDEVQAFLNSLSHEWERVHDDYKEMKIRHEGIQKEVEKLREVESSLYKTLKTAEDTGTSLVEQAKRSAELQIREAQMKAEDTIKKANEKAKYIVENAERTSKAILEEMRDAIKSVETDFHRLESLKESLLLELKNLSKDTLEKVEKYKDQKNRFDFDEHLKKAKSFARLNKDYSYYSFKPESEENMAPLEDAGEQHAPEKTQPLEKMNSHEDLPLQTEDLPVRTVEEPDKPDKGKPFSYEPVRVPQEAENQTQEPEPKEAVQPDREERGKKQNRSFFDELD
jgi:cell division initiation protein